MTVARIFVAGLSLVALSTLSVAPALAQVAPGNRGTPARSTTAPAAQAPTARTPCDAAGNCIAFTPDQIGGIRSPQWGDNSMGALSLEDTVRFFTARGMTAADARQQFDRLKQENLTSCQRTGRWVRNSIAIANEAMLIDKELVGLYTTLDRLGRAQGRAGVLSIAANVGATGALCALSAGLYCVAGALINGGSVLNTGAHLKTQRVDRQMRYLNVDQSRLQIKATLLNMEATAAWAERFQGWCLIVFPQQTAGAETATAVQDLLKEEPVALWSTGQLKQQRDEQRAKRRR